MRKEKDRNGHEAAAAARVYGKQDGASFQVIMLGSSGGPREDTVTGLLVRSTASGWRKGSIIAVDAGAHLAKVVRVLEDQHGLPPHSDSIPSAGYSKPLTDGPFAGVQCPGISAKANALYIFRELLHSFLITHPHLDHISGMAINTPALEFGREPKAIVALPSVIDAIKNHIFNDVIWPNLSDEGDGVGFVTYRRLIEGGNPRLGSGEGRGYVNVCDGLATKCWSISHGRCKRQRHSFSHHRDGSFGVAHEGYPFPSHRISMAADGVANAITTQASHHPTFSKTPSAAAHGHGEGSDTTTAHLQAVDSSVFFIRNNSNGHEIIVFGDVEPDSLSMHPRNQAVWEDTAAKIASGRLKAIFIECSFDNSARDQDLYGHLCPRHLIAELGVLAGKVTGHRQTMNIHDPPSPEIVKQENEKEKKKKKKRKRRSDADVSVIVPATNGSSPSLPAPPSIPRPRPTRTRTAAAAAESRSTSTEDPTNPPPHPHPFPLQGLTVYIIHVKDTMSDGPPLGQVILKQLVEGGVIAGLGCTFNVTADGESIWI